MGHVHLANRGFPRVHWYSGTTANDRSYARWALNFDPNNPGTFINIDFQRDNGNGAAAIRYTNSIPGVPENGGYIEYRRVPAPPTGSTGHTRYTRPRSTTCWRSTGTASTKTAG
ncbi:MAG: hypothetical protein H6559_37575 [Lewinellaceae bacterium]|nr:hypothetical protein [Lewinellaceae bacterium]